LPFAIQMGVAAWRSPETEYFRYRIQVTVGDGITVIVTIIGQKFLLIFLCIYVIFRKIY